MNDSINTRTKNASKDNQMKSKLDAMGLFEEGMSRQEMENLLKALDSSKNDTMSQGTADDVSPPSVETDLMIRQSSVEYDDQTPPINHRAFHTKNQDVKSQKLNTPLSIVDSDEEIFERNDDNNITNNIINRQSSTPTYANMLQQKNMNNRTMKIFSKIDNINNDLRCMDPLDHEETHDKPLLPLRTKNPPADSRKIMVINKKPIIPTDELESIKKHIDDVINQWQKWELETSDEVEFRWGAPIQAGVDSTINEKHHNETRTPVTATTQRRLYIDDDDDDDDDEGDFHKNTGVALRADYNDNKTQRSYVIPRRQTAKTGPYNFGDDDDDDDDDELLQSQPKRPKSNNNNNLGEIRNQPPLKRKGLGTNTSQQKIYDVNYNNNNDDDEDDGGEWLGGKKKDKNKSFEVPDTEYLPRRVPPPIRGAKATRGRKSLLKLNQLTITKQKSKKADIEEMDISDETPIKNKVSLKDNEITHLINGDDNDDDDDDNTPDDAINNFDNEENKILRPKLLNPLNNKLNNSVRALKNKQKMLKDKELREQEEERIKIEKEEAAKREKLNAKITKNNELELEKEKERRLRKDREDIYRKTFPKIGNSSDRNELKSDGDTIRPVLTTIWDPKNNAFPLATSRSTPNQKVKNIITVDCPICHKLFPESDVETHASSCNEFPIDNQQKFDLEDMRTPSSSKLVCGICNNFSTSDTSKYNDHQHECNFKLNSRDGEASSSQSDKSIIDLDDSEQELGFKPISEVNNPELYNNQFKVKKPSGKSPAILTRKRKR